MDTQLLTEFSKFGALGLAFAVLLFWILRTFDKTGAELTRRNDQLATLVENNTSAMVALKNTLDSRPCIVEGENVAAKGRGLREMRA